MTSSSTSEAAPTTSVVVLVSGSALIVHQSSCMYVPVSMSTPNSLCDWSMMIPIEKPRMNPAMTALERKVETHPMRRSPSAR